MSFPYDPNGGPYYALRRIVKQGTAVTPEVLRALQDVIEATGLDLDQIEEHFPTLWTSYDEIPCGVLFLAPGRGDERVVFAKIQGGILLNFGTELMAPDSKPIASALTVGERVLREETRFIEFLFAPEDAARLGTPTRS